MTDQEQVDGLYAVQGYDHVVEEQLHEARVLSVRPFDAGRVHMSKAYELVLDSGHICIFKPADSLLEAAADGLYHGKQALAKYDHTPVSTTISECAAWQLAKHLGPPWSDLLVPTVIKFAAHPETRDPMVGAASLFRGGAAGKQGFYTAVLGQVSSAAFFDALIGQQDRNTGNVLWYEERQLIYLIDHAFSFARHDANHGAFDLVQWRWNHGSRDLTDAELNALERLLGSDDLMTLRRFVHPERVEALEARAQLMLDGHRMVREF